MGDFRLQNTNLGLVFIGFGEKWESNEFRHQENNYFRFSPSQHFSKTEKVGWWEIFFAISPLPARKVIWTFAGAVLAVVNRPDTQKREVSTFGWNFNFSLKWWNSWNFHKFQFFDISRPPSLNPSRTNGILGVLRLRNTENCKFS